MGQGMQYLTVWGSEDNFRCHFSPSTLFEAGSIVHQGIYLAGLQLARIRHGRTNIVNACYRAGFTWA